MGHKSMVKGGGETDMLEPALGVRDSVGVKVPASAGARSTSSSKLESEPHTLLPSRDTLTVLSSQTPSSCST